MHCHVEKLIDFVGARDEITAQDIDAVLKRTKIDPVFELTNAVADRNLQQALFQTNALLGAGWHPLQILSALANQVRKLLVAKDFVHSQWGQPWTSGVSYPLFQKRVMPGIQAFDQHNREQNADNRNSQAHLVVKQVAHGERQDHWVFRLSN